MHPAVDYFRALFEEGDTLCLTFIPAEDVRRTDPLNVKQIRSVQRSCLRTLVSKPEKHNETEHVYVSHDHLSTEQHQARERKYRTLAHVFVEADERARKFWLRFEPVLRQMRFPRQR